MTAQTSAELVQAILEGGDVAPEIGALVLSKAGGNPLFVEELACIVELVPYEDVRAGYVERPKGIRIRSGVMRPEQLLDAVPDGSLSSTCSLRVIPSPEKDKDPSLVELIRGDSILSSVEVWLGPGNCSFTGASVLDPWHKLPVVNRIASTYLVSDFFIDGGKILETL